MSTQSVQRLTATIARAATPFIGEASARELGNNLGGCDLADLTLLSVTESIERRIRMGQCSCDAAACARAILYAIARSALVVRANEVGRASRREGAPTLTAESDAADVAAWLHWCDPNGCHTPVLAAGECFDVYSTDEAWEALALMLADD